MITLASTKLAFDAWRITKTNDKSPIPVELWDMVKQLLASYKQTEICKVLRISGNQIKTHCITPSITKGQAMQPSQAIGNFVEATPALNVGMTELILKGDSKSLHVALPISALHEVLPMLGALL